MEGISKQYLKNSLASINGAPIDDAIKSAFTILIEKLIAECQELQEPWMTLDEFLKSGFVGECWICNHNKDVATAYYSKDGCFYQSITSSVVVSAFDIYKVMPIHKPEPPKL